MKRKLILSLTAVCLALMLRWYASISLPTDYDEAVYYTAARYYADAFRTQQWALIPAITFNYEHPPLAKIIYGAVLAHFPSDGPLTDDVWTYFHNLQPLAETDDPFRILVLRQVSVGFGTLQVLFLSFFSPIAALLLAIDSMDIKYSSVIYLEALPASLAMASILLFNLAAGWLGTREKISLRYHGKEILWVILSAVCLGLAAASKYSYAIAGVAIMIYAVIWILLPRPGDVFRYIVLAGFGFLALGAFVAADPYLWPAPIGRILHSTMFSYLYSHSSAVQSAGYPFYQPLIWLSKSAPAQPPLAVPVTGSEFIFQLDFLIGLLALVGLPKMFRENKLLFTWLLTGIIFLLIWSTKWPQYSLIVIGPLCIAASEGIKTVWAFFSNYLRSKRPDNSVAEGKE